MSRVDLKAGTLLSPLPAVMVSVGDMEDSNIITIAWCGILNSHPPRTYISVRPQRHSYEILKQRGEFVINIPSQDMVKSLDFCGVFTGKKVDKFKKCNLTKVQSKEVSAPTIGECPMAIECKICDIIPMGSHDVFVADIVNISADENLMDKDGRLMLDKARLVCYAHGEYFAVGKRIGKFGFSAIKKKKKGGKGKK